jgi:hypothetical protein
MSRPLSLALTAATICTLALPLPESQAPIFTDAQSFYIVAVRASVDTSLFRVCTIRRTRPLTAPSVTSGWRCVAPV